MERLWTPWRMSYVSQRHSSGCVLCVSDCSDTDVERLVLYRGANAYAMLNLYPYNTGHLMVVPYDHVATLDDLPADTRHEIIDIASDMMHVSRRVLRCDGFNMGMNIGETAGAGVAHHVHLHVVPRWTGDANFMPILGDTMVLPELLPATYAKLRAERESVMASQRPGVVPQAGAIVVIPARGAVALRRSATGDLVLPKGHIELGESVVEAALREANEETGLNVALAGWAGTSEFDWPAVDGHQRRHVCYVIATGVETDESRRHLDVDTVLVPIDDSPASVSIPELAQLLDNLRPILHRLSDGLS